ncbi:hypothetical protein [Amycolatopsis kentuckyensis]|uniref:hypothetical protein n=1 Tax=Amycolatopsis kentuckyensis TaxID=218823 RepID=UPI00356B3522
MSNNPIGIGIRHYSGDALRHAYRIVPLAKLELRRQLEIHSVCHELLDGMLGLSHIYDMVNRTNFKHLGGPFNGCPLCAVWLATNPHEVIADGLVVAVGGILPDIPEPRWPGRERVVRRPARAAP